MNRKTIEINEIPELHEKSKALLEAVREAERDVYRVDNIIVRVINNSNVARIEPINQYELRHEISQSAKCVKKHQDRKDNWIYKEIPPPLDVCRDALASSHIPLPEIKGVVLHPVVSLNGEISDKTGYDKNTCLYIDTKDEIITALRDVSDNPSYDDIKNAFANIWDIFSDFKFKNIGSIAALYALLLTFICRPSINENIPAFVIKASTPGTGKTLLAKAVIGIITGREAVTASLETNEEELAKDMHSRLLAGQEYIIFDNVNTKIKSGIIAQILTSGIFSKRLLGQPKNKEVANNSTIIFTGNNPELSAEIARRCIPIELISEVERPELRTGFKYRKLLEHILKNQATLLRSLFVMVQAWKVSDKSYSGDAATLGSFSKWSRAIGGILHVCGIPGFLSNHGDFANTADTDTDTCRQFFIKWYETHGGNPVSAKDLLDIAKEIGLTDTRRDERFQIKSLGRYISKHEGQIYENLKMEPGSQNRGVRRYKISDIDLKG
ncbi:MAG: hypothetical protein FWC21_04685 [Treponema sp.]|nr:hypothetical protein [Treponema sp.]